MHRMIHGSVVRNLTPKDMESAPSGSRSTPIEAKKEDVSCNYEAKELDTVKNRAMPEYNLKVHQPVSEPVRTRMSYMSITCQRPYGQRHNRGIMKRERPHFSIRET